MTHHEKAFLEGLLSTKQPFEHSPERFSTIALLLRNARHMTGRNLETGAYEKNELCNLEIDKNGLFEPQKFNGLINYLIFLEQLGHIFIHDKTGKLNKIDILLKQYAKNLNSDERNAIRALRNALAHQFGLAIVSLNTKTKKINPKFTHKFTLSIASGSSIIKLGKSPWKGDFKDKSDETSTTVYIYKLHELAELILSKIQNDISNNSISIRLPLEEIKTRFTIIY